MWENYVTVVLNVKKLFKWYTECKKIIWEVLNVKKTVRDVLYAIKLCKRCAEDDKLSKRGTEFERNM